MKTTFLIFLVILCSCANNNPTNTIRTIRIESCLDDPGRKLPLSHYASSIEYIVLQSDSNCFFGPLSNPAHDIQFQDSLIFISDGSQLLLFNYDGTFLRKIGSKGKGPGEYVNIRNFTTLPKSCQVIIFSSMSQELLYYDFYGNYLKKYPVDFLPTEILTYRNKLIALNPRGLRKYSDYYTFTNLDDSGKIDERILFHQNEKDLETRGKQVGIAALTINHYFNQDTLYYWESIYDTIWRISPAFKETPAYFIDYGPNKLPGKFILKSYARLYDEMDQYVKLSVMIATKNQFFFKLDNKIDLALILYDLSNGSCSKVRYMDTVSSLPVFGLNNDIDGGLPYWPIGQVNDSITFSLVYGYMLKTIINANTSKSVRDIVLNTKQFDNPILMLVKHKME